MANRKFLEKYSYLGEEYFDTSKWPQVLVENLKPEDKETFLRRKEAVDYFMNGTVSLQEIKNTTGIDRQEVYTYVDRCLQFDETGTVWGYRALIPQRRIKNYTRKSLPSLHKPTSYTGAFQLLLETYPSLKQLIDETYLATNRRRPNEKIIRVKHLHKKFVAECRKIGIKPSEYPFTNRDFGKRALERYVKKLESEQYDQAVNRFGEDAARYASTTGAADIHNPMTKMPFERVYFDGHRIDAMFTITYHTIEGDEITVVVNRLWILTIVDDSTRSVLGHYISLNKEYTAEDVLKCIRNAIEPWKPKQLTIPGLKYPENGGYPSAVIAETEWGLWDEILFDNAKANLANIVRERLTRSIGCDVNAGPVKTPVRRYVVERFYRTLEENGYQRLPSSTGSHPKDPRRNKPEENALYYNISIEHLEELTDVLLANYNNTPHEAIYNMTPLEIMQSRLARENTVREMPVEKRDEIMFLNLKVQRTIRGNKTTGKRPYIVYEGVPYRNDIISRTPDLIGTTLDLLVNVEDLRFLRAFLPDGSELGLLKATGKWGVTPHSLQLRKAINQARNKKLIHYTSTDDPIEIYRNYLHSTAGKINRIEINLLKCNDNRKSIRLWNRKTRSQPLQLCW